MARLLDQLSATPPDRKHPVLPQACLDADQFLSFLPRFNGVSIIKAQVAELEAQVDVPPTFVQPY